MALVPFPGPQSGALARALVPDEEESPGGQMSFLEHLDELRKRIVNALIAVGVGVVLGFFLIDRISDFLLGPTRRLLPPGSKMIYTQPGEAFSSDVQIALIAGVIFAAPVIMYQVWMFIAPGLYANEKKFAIPFALFSTVFFIAGAAFAHYALFPWTWAFFGSFSNENLVFMPSIQPVFSMYTKMLLAMGLVFEMPTVVFFLARIGLVTAKLMLSMFKYAILVIFIAAAVLTPGQDIASQCLMAGPMVGLYIVSIGIAWAFGKSRSSE